MSETDIDQLKKRVAALEEKMEKMERLLKSRGDASLDSLLGQSEWKE